MLNKPIVPSGSGCLCVAQKRVYSGASPIERVLYSVLPMGGREQSSACLGFDSLVYKRINLPTTAIRFLGHDLRVLETVPVSARCSGLT